MSATNAALAEALNSLPNGLDFFYPEPLGLFTDHYSWI